MKNFKYIVLAIALSFATMASAADNYRNATFNFGQSNYVDYSFGGIQIGETSGTAITEPFLVQNPNGQDTMYETSGTVISDPFSLQNPQSNSTDMNGLLGYMSTQQFNVEQTGMYMNYNVVESTNNPTFNYTQNAGTLSAVVEIVNAADGSVLESAYTLPSFSGNSLVQGAQVNFKYNIPDKYLGMEIYIRLHVSESSSVPYTSTGTSSMTYLGWSPNVLGIFGKQVDGVVASSTQLLGNYPNPVVNTTTISVQNTTNASSLKVYDVLGRLVSDLTNQMPHTDGIANIMFNASQLQNGIYFYRLQAADGTVSQRELIVKR